MSISTIESIIAYLEGSNDPATAYFSYSVDDTGDYGVIKANKEGLRLYAMELLKKSLEMEKKQDGHFLAFQPSEWIVSDAGYDLIAFVEPQYQPRENILSDSLPHQ